MLVVGSALAALNDSREGVHRNLAADQLRVLSLLPELLRFVPDLFADDTFVRSFHSQSHEQADDSIPGGA